MLLSFRPSLPFTIACFVALLILVGLGLWQARKIVPKSAMIDAIEQGFSAPAIPLPKNSISDFSFRHVTVSGTLASQTPIRHYLTNLKGKPGYHLYWPVMLTGTDSQSKEYQYIFVNFGWVPVDYKLSAMNLPEQSMTLSGYLRPFAKAAPLQAKNNRELNQWYVADIDEMSAYFNLDVDQLYPMRLIIDGVQSSDYPLIGQMHIDIPNKHLEYAFTWFGIAGALIAVYVGVGFQRGKQLTILDE